MAGGAPRKLLFYTYALQMGGAERVCALLASAFAERGDSVTLAVDVEAESDVPLSDRVRKLALGRGHARSLAALVSLIGVEKPDVSLSALAASNLKHALAALRAGRAGRAILSYHGYFDAEPQLLSRAGFIALPVIARATAACVCVSDGLLAHVRRFGAPARKTRRIFNPVQLAPPTDVATAATLAARPPLVLAVGRLNPVKAFDVLIRAFARVKTPGARLRIVGEGPEREMLAGLIVSLGLQDRVELAGASADVSAHYREARCLALTSRSESFGNVVVEALSHGLPVVATDCGGPSEIIESAACGLIAPVGGAEDIARAIDAVLAAPGDPEPRLRRASEFSIARAVAAYDSLFDDVIGAADGRRGSGAASS